MTGKAKPLAPMTAQPPPSDQAAPPLLADTLPAWAPLRAAIMAAAAANALGFWDDGCRLWRDLFRRNAVGSLAAHGGAEAALHAGRFAFADHMLAHLAVRTDGLSAALASAEPIRAARKEARQSRAKLSDILVVEQQFELHLYDDMLTEFVRMQRPNAFLPTVAKALHGLGRHDLVLAMADGEDANMPESLMADSRDRLERRRTVAAEAADEWLEAHRFLLDGNAL